MKILTNNKLSFNFYLFVFFVASVLQAYSQEANNIETLSETVSPLKSVISNNYEDNSDQDDEIKSFLKELENSDTKAINFSATINSSNNIIYNQDNITEGINIFNDNVSNQLIEELSNNNVLLLNNEKYEEQNNNVNVLTNYNEENNSNDNKSLNFPIVDKSELDKVKLSTIGLDNNGFLPENINIWNKTSFERAIFLLDSLYYDIDSYVLKKIIKKILSVSQDPPKGQITLENNFINKKLMLLANLNDFETLYRLIDLLPNDVDFDLWRALRVQHYFLNGAFETDSYACRIVNDVSLRNSDSFWKKAQIFCQIIKGNEDDALFDAGLLKASGSDDENFFNLLNSLMVLL